MSNDRFYRWTIDCPNNVPHELIEYILSIKNLTDVEIDVDFITFDIYGIKPMYIESLFYLIEQILIGSNVVYSMEVITYMATGDTLFSGSDEDAEFNC